MDDTDFPENPKDFGQSFLQVMKPRTFLKKTKKDVDKKLEDRNIYG